MRFDRRFVLICLLFAACGGGGCQSKSPEGNPGGSTIGATSPTKPPKELIAGVWSAFLEVDVPALAKLREVTDKIPPDKAQQKAEEFQNLFIDRPEARLQVTWQFNPDGTAIVRRKMAMQADSDFRRQLTWKLIAEDNHSATLELTDKHRDKKSRTIKITFQNDEKFRLDDDPELKGMWLVPVLNPVFERDTSGTDLKQVQQDLPWQRDSPKVPVGTHWADEKAVLAAAPKTELKPREFEWFDDTFVIDVPADATVETSFSEPVKVKLSSGAIVKIDVGYTNLVSRRQWAGVRFGESNGLKELSFVGENLLIFEEQGKGETRYRAYANMTDGARDYEISMDNPKGSGLVSLLDCLLLLKCAESIRPKTPYPKKLSDLLARLRIRSEPKYEDDPAKVVALSYRDDPGPRQLAFATRFPNLESLEISMVKMYESPACLEPLLKLKKLKRFALIHTGLRGPDEKHMRTLSQISSLRELDIKASDATEQWFIHLSRLKGLTTLNLGWIDKKGLPGLTHLSACKNLEDLTITPDFGDLDIYEDALGVLSQLPKLRKLSINANITDRTCRIIGAITSLETLEVKNSKISDSNIALLAKSSQLKSLTILGTEYGADLKKIPVTAAAMKHLAATKTLETMKLSGLPLGDDAMAEIAKLPNLKELSLEMTSLTAKGLMALKDAPKLRRLHLGQHETLNDVLIDDFKQSAPQITVK